MLAADTVQLPQPFGLRLFTADLSTPRSLLELISTVGNVTEEYLPRKELTLKVASAGSLILPDNVMWCGPENATLRILSVPTTPKRTLFASSVDEPADKRQFFSPR